MRRLWDYLYFKYVYKVPRPYLDRGFNLAVHRHMWNYYRSHNWALDRKEGNNVKGD